MSLEKKLIFFFIVFFVHADKHDDWKKVQIKWWNQEDVKLARAYREIYEAFGYSKGLEMIDEKYHKERFEEYIKTNCRYGFMEWRE